MISIYNNLPANNVARVLSSHYSELRTSTQRLSSGLRINGAADDAAGLAIRELMRSDIAALRQGMRNVNDAISMLQTMDGALGVIDEKLIRMKELAEQAATGTYDSTQRLMIDSEFQAMGSEIDRIARATDFNGVKLLTAQMITKPTGKDIFKVTNSGTIENPQPATGFTAKLNIDPNLYINANNLTETISISLTAAEADKTTPAADQVLELISSTTDPNNGRIDKVYKLKDTQYTIAAVGTSAMGGEPVFTYTSKDGWSVTNSNNTINYDQVTVNNAGKLTAFDSNSLTSSQLTIRDNKTGKDMDLSNLAASNIVAITIDIPNNSYSITKKVTELSPTDPQKADYTFSNDDSKVNLNGGGSVTLNFANPPANGDTISFDIKMEGAMVPETIDEPDPDAKVKIHFGTANDAAEDYYYIQYQNCTREGLGVDDVTIETQQNAQEALVKINDAIIVKDKARAYFGAMQNRLENTLQVNTIQAENLQAAESRISDADIAQEMMTFVRNQILTNSAVAMLAQANSLPQMVMTLIH